MRKRKNTFDTEDAVPDLYQVIDLDSLVVAHYAVNEKMSYEDIQKMMGLSRATVARRLQHAKNNGWLIEKPILNVPPLLGEQFRQRIQETNLQKQLVERLGDYGLRGATVVFDKEVGRDEYEVSQRVGQATAARLAHALTGRSGYIGINWGHAVRWAIEYLPKQERKHERLTFVPLMGNLSVDEAQRKEFEEAWRCSSNRLTRLAAEAFGTGPSRRLTTPAFISKRFLGDRARLSVIWELINEDISYQRILGRGHHNSAAVRVNQSDCQDEPPLIEKMDTIVTGMSALQPESALVTIANLVDDDELAMLRANGYVGDLGGHPIFDGELGKPSDEAKTLADSVSKLVISALPEDFRRVAQRARDENSNCKGVFMTGTGPQKARAFLAAIKMGVVSELITDRATCQQMLELLDG